MVIDPKRRGEVLLTADEHQSITKLIRPYPDGTLPPGYVTLIVDAADRLARFREGVTRILYEVPGGYETLCIASLHTCPVLPPQGEHTLQSRYCYQGENDEWWIILPGGKLMFITPDESLRLYRDVVIVFEILSYVRPSTPRLLIPERTDRVEVSVLGAK